MEIFNKMNKLAQDSYDEAAKQNLEKKKYMFHEVEIPVDKLIPLDIVHINKDIFERGVNERMAMFLSYLKSVSNVFIGNGLYLRDVNEHIATIVEMSLNSFKKGTAKKKSEGDGSTPSQ